MAENAALHRAVACKGASQATWEQIAAQLGTGRSAAAVQQHWKILAAHHAHCDAKLQDAGLAQLGLPVSVQRISRGPPSLIIAASCLLFALVGLMGLRNGDIVTAALAVCQTALSLTADFIANSSFLAEHTIAVVCACDRGVATAFALWLVVLSTAAVSKWMVVALLPLAMCMGWSRASGSRSQWIWRHSVWHAFAVLEAVGVLAASYQAEQAAPPHERILANDARVTRLAVGPLVVGALLAFHGATSAK